MASNSFIHSSISSFTPINSSTNHLSSCNESAYGNTGVVPVSKISPEKRPISCDEYETNFLQNDRNSLNQYQTSSDNCDKVLINSFDDLNQSDVSKSNKSDSRFVKSSYFSHNKEQYNDRDSIFYKPKNYSYEQSDNNSNESSSNYERQRIAHGIPCSSDNYFSTLPLHYENLPSTSNLVRYNEEIRDPAYQSHDRNLYPNIEKLSRDKPRFFHQSSSGVSPFRDFQNRESPKAQNVFGSSSSNTDFNMTYKVNPNYPSFYPYMNEMDNFSKNLTEIAKRSLLPHESYLRLRREDDFGSELKGAESSSRNVPSTYFDGCINPSPSHDNREEKHFTDISGHTVQKLTYLSESNMNKPTSVFDLRKDSTSYYNKTFPISNDFTVSFSEANLLQESTSGGLAGKVSSDQLDSNYNNEPTSLYGNRKIMPLSGYYPLDSGEFGNDQHSSNVTSLANIMPERSFSKSYDNNSEKLEHSVDELYQTSYPNITGCVDDDLTTRNVGANLILPPVGEMCLNLSMPHFSRQPSLPNALTMEQSKIGFGEHINKNNPASFNSLLNTSFDLNASSVSPVHSALNTNISQHANIDDIVQSNLPNLDTSISAFQNYDLIPYSGSYETDSLKNEETNDVLPSSSHPINLVMESQDVHQIQSNLQRLDTSEINEEDVPTSSHQDIPLSKNKYSPILSHSVKSITANDTKTDPSYDERSSQSTSTSIVNSKSTSRICKNKNSTPTHFLSNLLKDRLDSDVKSSLLNTKRRKNANKFPRRVKLINSDGEQSTIQKEFKSKNNFSSRCKSKDHDRCSTCSRCSLLLCSTKSSSRHEVLPQSSGTLECNVCKSSFKNKSSLREHETKLCNKRRHLCNFCHKSLGGYSSLITHKHIHTGEKTHTCPHCEKKFRHNATLKSHILTHTGERPFHCNICSLRFSQRASLSRHLRTHAEDRSFECSLCKRILKDKDNLLRHMKMKHIPCPYCDLKFMNNKELNKHFKEKHSDERAFKCELCPSTFSVKSNYVKHKRTIHRETDLKCEECGAVFKRIDRLNAHRKVHGKDGDESLYKCSICHASFTQQNTLSKHSRAIHDVALKAD